MYIFYPKIEFNEIRDGNIIALADAVFLNPNNRGGKVKKVDISAFVEEKESAKVLRTEPFKVKPNSEFIIPLDLEIGFDELAKNFFTNLLSRKKEKSLPLRFKGHIWITVYGITKKVPIDYQATLTYRL